MILPEVKMNPWLMIVLAGLFEIAFTTFMKLSNGFTQLVYVGLFLVASLFSFLFLTLASRVLPLGTAYAVWTGMGAVGTAAVGMIFFEDPATWARIAILGVLIAGIVGLRLVS